MAKKILKDIKDIKFITIGEVLLRLSPPNFEKSEWLTHIPSTMAVLRRM